MKRSEILTLGLNGCYKWSGSSRLERISWIQHLSVFRPLYYFEIIREIIKLLQMINTSMFQVIRQGNQWYPKNLFNFPIMRNEDVQDHNLLHWSIAPCTLPSHLLYKVIMFVLTWAFLLSFLVLLFVFFSLSFWCRWLAPGIWTPILMTVVSRWPDVSKQVGQSSWYKYWKRAHGSRERVWSCCSQICFK